VFFPPWHLAIAYGLDLILGDPSFLPHPIRWIGHFISWAETNLYPQGSSPGLQRVAGFFFWLVVMTGVGSATWLLMLMGSHLHSLLGQVLSIWLAYATLATRSLHRESSRVVKALRDKNLALARQELARIVSRDTQHLGEQEIIRALLETVSENTSDGIVAPLFYLAFGGPLLAILYKAVNTMDSMVGYLNERYRYFGSFAARADDAANWAPARVTGWLLVGAAACLNYDWPASQRIMRRDGRKLKSPNAGIPEAAVAGALGVRLGGANVYAGQVVDKATLGDTLKPLALEQYGAVIKLMYVTSLLAFLLAFGVRCIMALL
jgi:adenosylcobinamide-phosphate synthase